MKHKLYVLTGLALCVASAVFMGWLIAWLFGISYGPIMIVAGILGFAGGAVCMSAPEFALSPNAMSEEEIAKLFKE